MSEYIEKKVVIDNNGDAVTLFGKQDEHLRLIEQNFHTKVIARGNEIMIAGTKEEVIKTEKVFTELANLIKSGVSIDQMTVNYTLNQVKKDSQDIDLAHELSEVIYVTPKGRQIKPKTIGQKKYVQAMRHNDIVFGIGPAGTGKTYLAVLMAVLALKNKDVNRIILARPAVEAGEKLGFLPGDLQDKVNPYLRPLYDSLYDLLGFETAQKYMERTIIEVAPLAYMRGRTLDDSYVILDEAQNTTPEQMKMLLTRIGFGSKAVITGDITQVDLPNNVSGLVEARKVLRHIDGISFQYLTQADVVRHPLVQKIIQAYDSYQNQD
ncbi:PhoH family protein [Bacillota bacterium LX-D]|nr:PhoH family protein [Bacillota bacterium LX-D]